MAPRQVGVGPSVVWLVYFYAASMLILTIPGAGLYSATMFLIVGLLPLAANALMRPVSERRHLPE